MMLSPGKDTVAIVGNYNWEIYEDALLDGFRQNGYLGERCTLEYWSFPRKLLHPLILKELNSDFVREMQKMAPALIFLYRVNELYPRTIKKLKKLLPNTKIVIYHNDNPYVGLFNRVRYRHFLGCIKWSDITYVYRPSNLEQAKRFGSRETKLLLPYFYSKCHVTEPDAMTDKKNGLVFIGHYEYDRAQYLLHLIEHGVDFEVYGPGWDKRPEEMSALDRVLHPPVHGDMYRSVLAGSKVALCFLSKKNRDVYTRRNFEVPATGTMMLSEYTMELTTYFQPGKEAEFFRDKNELLNRVKFLMEKPDTIRRISIAGQRRVLASHSESARVAQIASDLADI